MTVRSFYLEYQGQASHKFWRGIQKGRFFLGHWGRVGTKGQFRLWKRSSERQAANDWADKKQDKLTRGYFEGADPLAPEARLQLLTTIVAEEPYELYWNTEPGHPVVADHLMQAVSETEACLSELGSPMGCQIRYHPDGEAGRVWLTDQDGSKIAFGYPPAEVVAGWTTDDLRRNLADYRSRDGWLGSDGTGSGVIETRRQWIDLPVRIFLSRLVAAAGIRVVDTFDDELMAMPVLPDLGLTFAWEQQAEGLQRAAQRLGWLPGLVTHSGRLTMDIGGQSVTLVSDW